MSRSVGRSLYAELTKDLRDAGEQRPAHTDAGEPLRAVRREIERGLLEALASAHAEKELPCLIDWPAQVRANPDRKSKQSVVTLLGDNEWKLVSQGHKFTEGPAVDKDGNPATRPEAPDGSRLGEPMPK